MDDFMRQYKEKMDQVTLSEEADEAILKALLEEEKVVPFTKVKRRLSAASVAAIVALASGVTAVAAVGGVMYHAHVTEVEGVGAVTSIGTSFYYDLLSMGDGTVYALTDNDAESELSDHHIVTWESTDAGATWTEVMAQPEQVKDSSTLEGTMGLDENGLVAYLLTEELDGEASNVKLCELHMNAYTQCNLDEVKAVMGRDPWNVKYVKSHTVALFSMDTCVLYDTEEETILKTLPYDMTMSCVTMEDQFLIYGKEISTCLDLTTLEECQPAVGLDAFVAEMYENNDQDVLPPMEATADGLMCLTSNGIYEYRNGETVRVRELPYDFTNGHAINGLMPACKVTEDIYFGCSFNDKGTVDLWQFDN